MTEDELYATLALAKLKGVTIIGFFNSADTIRLVTLELDGTFIVESEAWCYDDNSFAFSANGNSTYPINRVYSQLHQVLADYKYAVCIPDNECDIVLGDLYLSEKTMSYVKEVVNAC